MNEDERELLLKLAVIIYIQLKKTDCEDLADSIKILMAKIIKAEGGEV